MPTLRPSYASPPPESSPEAGWRAPTRSFAPLHFVRAVTPVNALALPVLPPIQDKDCARALERQIVNRARSPNILELALLGDAVTSQALIKALQRLRSDPHNGRQTRLIGQIKSNVTYSYIALAYQLVSPSSGQKRQKHYADLFEAYIGALEREEYPMLGQLLRDIFSPAVFPALAHWETDSHPYIAQQIPLPMNASTILNATSALAPRMPTDPPIFIDRGGARPKKKAGAKGPVVLGPMSKARFRIKSRATHPRGPLWGRREGDIDDPIVILDGPGHSRPTIQEPEVIDLTGDSDDESNALNENDIYARLQLF